MNLQLTELKNALTGQLRRNDTVSNNLANAQSFGFKKDKTFIEYVEDSKTGQKQQVSVNRVDFSQGTITQTHNPLDMAISGPGFFTIETEKGEAYTRNGHFSISNDGFLVSQTNDIVLGEHGRVHLSLDGMMQSNITVSPSGEIFADGKLIDRLLISQFSDTNQLSRGANNYFYASDELVPFQNDESTVYQGRLENANLNTMDEMITMIELQRHFESIQRVVSTLDDVLTKAATQVGRYQ
ncbi:MAG TPA: flagellar hook basal-body protein [Candidatus Marinimicrobia bacterium]|nr:flagellar hook basal-body protein [Candidatus Neomarinimicrobiota bacterium]